MNTLNHLALLFFDVQVTVFAPIPRRAPLELLQVVPRSSFPMLTTQAPSQTVQVLPATIQEGQFLEEVLGEQVAELADAANPGLVFLLVQNSSKSSSTFELVQSTLSDLFGEDVKMMYRYIGQVKAARGALYAQCKHLQQLLVEPVPTALDFQVPFQTIECSSCHKCIG